jgi:4a-hydroxytetrahydrobiopterin dehydratase
MTPVKLSNKAVNEHLNALNATLDENLQWSISDEGLFKEFKFTSFIEAFGWMAKIAIVAEKQNHHPEWFNVYNKVEIRLCTHDCDGISELDFEMARKMERLL